MPQIMAWNTWNSIYSKTLSKFSVKFRKGTFLIKLVGGGGGGRPVNLNLNRAYFRHLLRVVTARNALFVLFKAFFHSKNFKFACYLEAGAHLGCDQNLLYCALVYLCCTYFLPWNMSCWKRPWPYNLTVVETLKLVAVVNTAFLFCYDECVRGLFLILK